MKKIIKVNDEISILHTHKNRSARTEFMAWDMKRNYRLNNKSFEMDNCFIDWEKENPLSDYDLNFLISK